LQRLTNDNTTLARLTIGGTTFVKAVRCYAAAELSFAQAMRDFVTAMRNGVAAKYIKKREWMLEKAALQRLC